MNGLNRLNLEGCQTLGLKIIIGLQRNVVYPGFVLDRVVGLQRNVVYSGFVLDRVVGLQRNVVYSGFVLDRGVLLVS